MFCLFSGLGAMGGVAGGRRVPAELLTSGHLYKQHYCHTKKLLPAIYSSLPSKKDFFLFYRNYLTDG
jgi:hypothetical protein